MTRDGLIQLTCLYGPLASAGLLAWWTRPEKRFSTGLLFAVAWNAALLPWLDALAQAAEFWRYGPTEIRLGGMPLALYFGWVIGWGLVATLLVKALGGRIWIIAGLLIAVDLRTMPEMRPVLTLGTHWWIGEFFISAILLLPSLWIVKWTEHRERIGLRCAMLALSFGGIFIGLPLIIECGNVAAIFQRWLGFPESARIGFASAACLLSVPGLAAVRDLALSGGGTPVPLDPPRRLVTHGIYAFVRNPMQLSMTSLLLLEAAFLKSPWPLVLAAVGVVYSEGLARWSENEDMRQRFGEAWTGYRKSVRSWLPHWTPRVGEPCELWIDASCGVCCEVAHWFRNHEPLGLRIRPAAEWPGPPLARVTWRDPGSGRTESGVGGMAMAIQHLHLGWAFLGWIAGLPLIRHVLQICFDAAGAGPRAT